MRTPPEAMDGSATCALLKVAARTTADSYLLEVTGELDRSTVDLLHACLAEAEASDRGRIVVDLGGLSFMDSSGLRALLLAAGRTRADGDRLRVVGASRPVQRVIALTGTRSELPLVGAHDGGSGTDRSRLALGGGGGGGGPTGGG